MFRKFLVSSLCSLHLIFREQQTILKKANAEVKDLNKTTCEISVLLMTVMKWKTLKTTNNWKPEGVSQQQN